MIVTKEVCVRKVLICIHSFGNIALNPSLRKSKCELSKEFYGSRRKGGRKGGREGGREEGWMEGGREGGREQEGREGIRAIILFRRCIA